MMKNFLAVLACILALLLMAPAVWAESAVGGDAEATATATNVNIIPVGQAVRTDAQAEQDQTQGQLQGQSISNYISMYSEASRFAAAPYQLYPANLAVDFGNGNTYGNFVKVPAMFSVQKRFSRSQLQIMRNTSGTCVKFRTWGGPRQGEMKPTDYVDFVWELPAKQAVGPDGKPKFDEKGHPVMVAAVPEEWMQVGVGTATVTNGDQDTYSLVAEYGLHCLEIDKCNKVFFVGEGLKTFVRSWGANLSIGYTHANISSQGGNSGVGGAGAGISWGKSGRLADPWLQGHFIYDAAALPAQ